MQSSRATIDVWKPTALGELRGTRVILDPREYDLLIEEDQSKTRDDMHPTAPVVQVQFQREE